MDLSKLSSQLRVGRVLLVIAALFLGTTSAFAGALAVVPTGNIVDSGVPYALTTAWDFKLTQSFRVTALDFYSNGTPYTGSHPVGLWAASLDTGYAIGTLLATVTFGPSAPGTTNGLYHSISIAPVDLGPGAYEVGVLLQPGTDPYLFSQNSYTLQPGISFMGGHVETSGVFTYPGGANFVSGNFAANFETLPLSTSTPEPSSLWLVSLPCLMLALIAKIRSSSARVNAVQL